MADSPLYSSDEEQEATRKFLCCLYLKSRKPRGREVRENVTPRDIYDQLEMEAVTREDLKNQRVERLVTKNLKIHYITYGSTGRVKMTDLGNNYGYSKCDVAPTPD
ncbi:MAG: hypothetical protein WA667_23935 [Candidatus Nitrosopolaris sp.]